MKVLLINGGGKLPNLALMKYSTHFKAKGYEVGWNVPDPDIVVGSIVFDKDAHKPDAWRIWYSGAEILVGGPGHDPAIRLPAEVERCKPDYSLYPDYTDSIGRVTIGCPRNCYFCKVPAMGEVRYVQHIRDFYQGGVCRILDDNILAMPEAWSETATWLIENGVEARFDQGLDIRLVTEEIAGQISDINFGRRVYFAFDMLGYEAEVRRGVQFLKDAGIKGSRTAFYVYLHDEDHIPDAMKRWEILRELEVEPFLMVNADNLTPRLIRVRRRGDRPPIWRGLTAEEVFA